MSSESNDYPVNISVIDPLFHNPDNTEGIVQSKFNPDNKVDVTASGLFQGQEFKTELIERWKLGSSILQGPYLLQHQFSFQSDHFSILPQTQDIFCQQINEVQW